MTGWLLTTFEGLLTAPAGDRWELFWSPGLVTVDWKSSSSSDNGVRSKGVGFVATGGGFVVDGSVGAAAGIEFAAAADVGFATAGIGFAGAVIACGTELD